MGTSGHHSRRSDLGESAEGKQNLFYVILKEDLLVFLLRKGGCSGKNGIFISATGPNVNLNSTRGRALEKLKMSVHSLIHPGNMVPHLIRAYSKESIALAQAQQRKSDGKRKPKLRIAVVDADKVHGRAKYRDLRSLASQFGIRIPRRD